MKLKFAIIFIIFFMITSLYSHPHVYIDNYVQIVCDEVGIKQIVLYWELDDMFSQSLITDYDKNNDEEFDNAELKSLYNGAFINLKNYEYFTHIKIDGRQYKIDNILNFKAKIDSGIVSYEFTIPLDIKLNKENKKVNLAVYDPSYYCDVSSLTKSSISIKNAQNFAYTMSISENKDDSFYYGQITPSELTLNIRKKNVK